MRVRNKFVSGVGITLLSITLLGAIVEGTVTDILICGLALGWWLHYVFGTKPEPVIEPSFRCEVCKNFRLEADIAVYTKDFVQKGTDLVIQRNINYCNDNEDCAYGALAIMDKEQLRIERGKL